MITYKTIFSGHLEFGTQRTYDKVLQLFEHRTENYYRNAVLFKAEDIFDNEALTLDVPRHITQSTQKDWNNTTNLLRYVADFAVAGNFRAWKLENGKCLDHVDIEPDGDKVAIQQFLKGRELISEAGMENEAHKALTRAIKKFDRHAFAYERRGFTNYRLGNFDDALYDYQKSIDLSPNNAEPYVGLAYVKRKLGDLQGAIENLALATKKCIPHEFIYWQAKRVKGELHLELKEYQSAIADFKSFVNRIPKFTPDNPNVKRIKDVYANYGKALIGAGEYNTAIEMFNQSLAIKEINPEEFLYRGIARQKAGEKGYVKDWKEAAELGNKEAAELLETVAA